MSCFSGVREGPASRGETCTTRVARPARARAVALSRIVPVAVILLLAFSSAVWHAIDALYPHDDGANYLETAVGIYQRFESEGVGGGLRAAYVQRGWRPILFPVLAVPFLLLSGGGLKFSVGATLVVLYALFVAYCYLLLRLFLSRGRAIVALVGLATTPWIVNFSYLFFSEMALMALAAGSLFHLLRAAWFSSWPHSLLFGLLFGLVLCVRPIEALMAFALPVLLTVVQAARRGSVSGQDLVAAAAAILAGGAILIFRLVTGRPSTAVGLFALAAITAVYLVFVCRAGDAKTLPISLAVAVSLTIAGAWWLPGIQALYGWIYETSFGQMVHLYPRWGRLGLVDAFASFLRGLGGNQLIVLGGLSALTLAGFRRAKLPIWSLTLTAWGLGVVGLVAVTTAFSPGSDPRRAFVGFFILLAGLGVVAAHPSGPFPRARLAILAVFALSQSLTVAANAFDVSWPTQVNTAAPESTLMRPVRGTDPNALVFSRLRALGLNGVSIATFSLEIPAFRLPPQRIFDPGVLGVLAKEFAADMTFSYPWNFRTSEEGYKLLRELDYEYVLLDLSADRVVVDNPYSRLTLDLLSRVRAGLLEPVGLRLEHSFDVKGRSVGILRVLPPGDPLLRPEENLALAANGGVAGATSSQVGFPASNLNDGTGQAWGSAEGLGDTFAYVSRPSVFRASQLKIMLFSPGRRAHLRDVSVVATNDSPEASASWRVIRSRIRDKGPYAETVAIPDAGDKQVITLELDPTDPHLTRYRTYGIACLSATKGHRRNFLSAGTGVYIRELQIAGR